MRARTAPLAFSGPDAQSGTLEAAASTHKHGDAVEELTKALETQFVGKAVLVVCVINLCLSIAMLVGTAVGGLWG